jgi:O-antigen ligase
MARIFSRPAGRPALRRVDARTLALVFALLLAIAGTYQLVAVASLVNDVDLLPEPIAAQRLTPGVVSTMESPAITWSEGWTVTATGADPSEPADPFLQPAGVLTFEYVGRELALLTAVGDYWGYLYVTVDGQPATLLPDSRFHEPPVAPPAGYRPLLAPEAVDAEGAPAARWLRVHWEAEEFNESDVHEARIEVWRSWDQTPLRAIAVDVLPAEPYSRWPGVAFLVAAFWLSAAAWLPLLRRSADAVNAGRSPLAPTCIRFLSERSRKRAEWAAGVGVLLLAFAVWMSNGGPTFGFPVWIVGLTGLVILAVAGLVWPALWYAALFAALPLYYRFPLPLLPERSVNLVDTGVYLGLVIVSAHALLAVWIGRVGRARMAPGPLIMLLLVASWSLVAVHGAALVPQAIREVRTVFVMAVALALGLLLMFRTSRSARADIVVILGAWLVGAAVAAGITALLYPRPSVTLPAEGVIRLRGPYGSPNNLALYLDRTLAVALALAIAARDAQLRIVAAVGAAMMAAALVLTFSKGTLFIALPVTLITVAAGSAYVLRRQGRSTQVVWLLGGLAFVVAIALLPFVTTERLQTLFDLSEGTGFLRMNLWRAAWQMAVDHPLVGVGPDNFLYAYRSGYILPQAWMEPNLNHPHNFVLDWWTRLGIPGLILGLTFWAVLFAALVRRMTHAINQRESWPAVYMGLAAAVVASVAHGLLDASYALPDLMAVWALLTALATVESPQSLPRA